VKGLDHLAVHGRDPAALAEPPPETEAVLRLEIDAIHVQGRQAFWVSHTRGTLTGEVLGSLSLDTEVGRVGLAGGALDLRLESLQIADDAQVSADASIKGRIEVPPFRIAEAAGLDALRIPAMDVELNLGESTKEPERWIKVRLLLVRGVVNGEQAQAGNEQPVPCAFAIGAGPPRRVMTAGPRRTCTNFCMRGVPAGGTE
jgi:hypothetical protein